MCRTFIIITFVLLLGAACEKPSDNEICEKTLVSKLAGGWQKVEGRTKLDTFHLGIDGSTLNCGIPFLRRDTLSIDMDFQYIRMRTAVDPDCCSTVFGTYEKGHLETAGLTMFYVVADSLLMGFCELCQNPEPSREINVSSGTLRLLCFVDSDTIFAIEDEADDRRKPYWRR
jgi:hypothetical protein